MAPEVLLKRGYGMECDWWSLGAILYEMLVGYPPFCSDDSRMTCLKIIDWRTCLKFHNEPKISDEAKDLICKLICDVDKRLGIRGVEEIKGHPWFRGVKWESLYEMEAAYQPIVNGDLDTQNFEKFEWCRGCCSDRIRTFNRTTIPRFQFGHISIGCEPFTRVVLPGQHEREGRWWWEDAKAKECGLQKGNIKEDNLNGNGNVAVHANVTSEADLFTTSNIVNLTRSGIENLLKLDNRKESWVVVLYAPWCQVCQGMEGSFVDLADKLAGSGIKVAKFRAEGDDKEFAKQELQLGSFPTILLFPKHSSHPIKYPSEKRDVDSLMAFVNALQ